jgi:cob(I)alamin adenosyltransferase
MSILNRGYIQIYTGDGKGKTTAAIGQGVRAAGRRLKVQMIQFLKSSSSGELESLELLKPYFEVFRFERKHGFFWTLSENEKKEVKEDVQKAYFHILDVVRNKDCDVLILDEIMGALSNKLITEEQIVAIIDLKPQSMEIIMTGRNAPEAIIEKADLVTEMKLIKHYFQEGVAAREGIEY